MNNTVKKYEDLSLVVLSSESYSFLWNNFINCWKKYCNSLKIDKFIITTNKTKYLKGFKVISGHLDKNDFWSKRIKFALKKIKTKNILIFTDDCFVDNFLDLNHFEKIYGIFKKKNFLHLRLSPIPNENYFDKKNIYKLDYHSFHRISLQPGLWNKNYLIEMLSHNESPRQFEENGSKRTKATASIYSTNYYVINYKELIRIGKITPEGKKLILNEKLKISKKYKYMNIFETCDHYFKKIIGNIFYFFPKAIRKLYIRQKYTKF